MQLNLNISYTLELDNKELRLVTAALRGTLPESRREEAIELQKRIAKTRVAQFEAYGREMEKLRKNVEFDDVVDEFKAKDR